MSIVDNLEQWQADFKAGWLKTYLETGELDWKVYNLPKNETTVSGPAVDLSKSRLAVITTGGFYLEGEQEPFDEPDMHGRYDIRLLPADTPPENFSITHTHYNHDAVNEDRQVLLPMGHLAEMVAAGEIGEIAPNIVSFMGYQPDVTRVIDETIPAVVAACKEMEVTAALLVPAWPICSQSVGLIARALEEAGIATTLTSWNGGRTRVTKPPRATFTKLNRGSTMGAPGDADQQKRVLRATLDLLAQDAPIDPIMLKETME